jgi:hypothetical protein
MRDVEGKLDNLKLTPEKRIEKVKEIWKEKQEEQSKQNVKPVGRPQQVSQSNSN